MEMNPFRYRVPSGGRDGAEPEFSGRMGFTSIEVLHELKGRPWDDLTFGMLAAVRPSRIRVIPHGHDQQCDAQSWRVTVYLTEGDETIERITQEVQIALPDDITHGHHAWLVMRGELQRGKPFPETRCYVNMEGLKKVKFT